MKKKKKRYTPEHMCELQLVGIVLFLIVAFLLAMLSSCTTTRTVQVPVEVEKTIVRSDTLRLHTLSIDTVVERDSVFIWQRGDTITKEVARWRYKVRLLTDTLWLSRIDSVFIEKPVTISIPVERKLSLWERIKLSCGGFALAALLVAAACLLFRLRRKSL